MYKRFILVITLLLSLPVASEGIDKYQLLNYLDNYGNIDLRDKPFDSLPTGLKVKGNLNISETPITRLPADIDIQGSLNASNSKLRSVPAGVKIKAMPIF